MSQKGIRPMNYLLRTDAALTYSDQTLPIVLPGFLLLMGAAAETWALHLPFRMPHFVSSMAHRVNKSAIL